MKNREEEHSLKSLVLVDGARTIDSQRTNTSLITSIRSTVRDGRVVIPTNGIFMIDGYGGFVGDLLFLVEGLMMGGWDLDLKKERFSHCQCKCNELTFTAHSVVSRIYLILCTPFAR